MNIHSENPIKKQAANLTKPTVPGAFENGLLPITLLTAPVRVTFPAWMASDFEKYQLLLNGNETGNSMDVPPGTQPGDILSLDIPVANLLEGTYQLRYRVTNTENGLSDNSDPTSVIIDLTEPGRPSLAAIQFPKVALDGLTSIELTQLGNTLPGEIYGYNGIAEEDVIQTYWGSVEGPSKDVKRVDIDAGKVIIPFTRAFLESLGDVQDPVIYHVTDRAGNRSKDSAPVTFPLQLQVFAPLPDPEVAEARLDSPLMGTLDPTDTTAGATVVIRVEAHLAEGDKVTVFWQGPAASDSKEKTIGPEDVDADVAIVFSSTLVSSNLGNTVTVRYDVRRANGKEQTSETLSLKVQAALNLIPPRVLEADAANHLDPDKVPASGATVLVPDYNMRADDVVAVSWIRNNEPQYTSPPQTVGTPAELSFIVPKNYVTASAGSSVTVVYAVVRGGAPGMPSQALPLTVGSATPELSFDPTPVTLAGVSYVIPGHAVLPAFGAGTSILRQASGGTPGYTYTSSAPQIAHVDAQGLVTVRGNGIATITAMDQSGQSKSFSVTVTGVIHCLGLGGGKYSVIASSATSQGLAIPSSQQLKDIQAAYSGRWPLGNAYYWSSTRAPGLIPKYYVLNLVTNAGAIASEHSPVMYGVGIRQS